MIKVLEKIVLYKGERGSRRQGKNVLRKCQGTIGQGKGMEENGIKGRKEAK